MIHETAAIDLATALAGTDQLQPEADHFMFLARGKVGPFRVDGEALRGHRRFRPHRCAAHPPRRGQRRPGRECRDAHLPRRRLTDRVLNRPGGFSDPGNCHRIALAVHDGAAAVEQWRRVFGAGLMMEALHDELDGSDMQIVWMGDVPFLALAASGPDGVVGRWLARHGPGVQSLAWEVPDMWSAQNHLQQAGIGITGVHIEGRHFFMHPRDTFGLMLELTDDRLDNDPRNGGSPIGGGDGLVQVARVAHVTAVVVDLEPVTALLRDVFGANPRPVGRPEGGDGPDVDCRRRHRRPHRAPRRAARSVECVARGRRRRAGHACTRSRSRWTSTPRPPGSRRRGSASHARNEGHCGSIPPTRSGCACSSSKPRPRPERQLSSIARACGLPARGR